MQKAAESGGRSCDAPYAAGGMESTRFAFARAFAAAAGALTAQAAIGEVAEARPAALGPREHPARPARVTQHQRQPRGEHDDPARTRDRADYRRQRDQQPAEAEQRVANRRVAGFGRAALVHRLDLGAVCWIGKAL